MGWLNRLRGVRLWRSQDYMEGWYWALERDDGETWGFETTFLKAYREGRRAARMSLPR